MSNAPIYCIEARDPDPHITEFQVYGFLRWQTFNILNSPTMMSICETTRGRANKIIGTRRKTDHCNCIKHQTLQRWNIQITINNNFNSFAMFLLFLFYFFARKNSKFSLIQQGWLNLELYFIQINSNRLECVQYYI